MKRGSSKFHFLVCVKWPLSRYDIITHSFGLMKLLAILASLLSMNT